MPLAKNKKGSSASQTGQQKQTVKSNGHVNRAPHDREFCDELFIIYRRYARTRIEIMGLNLTKTDVG